MKTRIATLAIVLMVLGLVTVSVNAQSDNRSATDLSWDSVNSQASVMGSGGCCPAKVEKKACCKEGTCKEEGGCKAGEAKKESCAKKSACKKGTEECKKAEAAQ